MVLLSDHITSKHPSPATRARRMAEHSAAVHAHSNAIAMAIRAVDTFCPCAENRKGTLYHSTRTNATLDNTFQADDGTIPLDLRL